MKTVLIESILIKMKRYLNNAQGRQLKTVLEEALKNYEIDMPERESSDNQSNCLEAFLTSKQIEGCSERTLKYYKSTIEALQDALQIDLRRVKTEDLRQYLVKYQKERSASKITIDNIRRVLSSFYSWLEDEDIILKNPVRRIRKVKTDRRLKETFSDEDLERMRDSCATDRDLAIVDLLATTGMRIGEMVGLDRNDVDFDNRECIVFGKGGKERTVYFDGRTKLHLERYLASRADNNPALFVSLNRPHTRVTIGGVEATLRKIGKRLGMQRVHPHKFRRTLATMAIDKGMPIEQLQCLLGHQRIDTTLQYAMVKQSNVKLAHKRYIG